MQKQLSELVDEYVVLLLKKEHGLPYSEEQLAAYEEEIPQELFPHFWGLKEVNGYMWDKMADFIGQDKDMASIGKKSIELEALNLMRNRIRNKITEVYGGYREEKRY